MATTPAPDPERIEAGWLLAGVGALLLLVSLFIDWFEPGVSAWTVFEALDLVLAGCAVVVLAYAARAFGLRAVTQTTAMLAAVVAFVVVASQIIDPPPVVFDEDIEPGAWLALSGAALMLVGALLSRTGVSFAVVVERRGERAPGPQAPPAPPPATPGETARLPSDEPRA